MTHLTPSEFVDLVDGRLDPARESHVDRCDACRAQADALRSTMRLASSDAAAEPSPLFWGHFQQRVERAISAEPAPRRSWFVLRPVPALATVMIVSIAIALGSLYPLRVHDERTRDSADSTSPASNASGQTDTGDDPAWIVLRDAASDMAIEDAHEAGMALRPGETENAVLQLTPDEREELGRLLHDALKRAGA
jgi:hypothetical protein